VSASGCQNGIGVAWSSSAAFGGSGCNVRATSNSNEGLEVRQGWIDGSPGGRIVAQGNGANGLKVEKGAVACSTNPAVPSWFKTNGVMGVAAYQGQATLGSAVFSGNTTNSINANLGANVDATGSSGVAGTCSPAINTIGNGNSYIAN
jgi:hypothetical protein